jgi:CRP/FNR family transcriptional regulator, cyclic AMP receptor protein
MRTRPLDAVEALAGTWFGARVPGAARERLAPHLSVASYDAGQEVQSEGEPMRHLGIVLTGRVALRLRVPERGPTTILTVEPGDIVGWSAVVPPHRATDTIVALIPTDLLLCDAAALRAELTADPELAAPVYLSLLEAMERRLTGTRLQLLDLFTMSRIEPW